MTSLWPHQSRRWSHWGASDTPVLLYLCHTQCRTLWSLAPRQTSHIRSHMTYSTGPGEEDQRETCSKSLVLLCHNDTTETTKHVLWQDIHRLCLYMCTGMRYDWYITWVFWVTGWKLSLNALKNQRGTSLNAPRHLMSCFTNKTSAY